MKEGKMMLKKFLVGFACVTFMILAMAAAPYSASAHTAQIVSERGSYLSTNHVGRNSCVHEVHFTLSRVMQHARQLRVTGPGHPVLVLVRNNQAIAVYNYGHGCMPDRHNRAWQFELFGFVR